MSVTSGTLTVTPTEAVLVYEAPAGVKTDIYLQANAVPGDLSAPPPPVLIGDSSVSPGSDTTAYSGYQLQAGLFPNAAPVILRSFTGSVYAIAEGGSGLASEVLLQFIATDDR